MLPRRDAPLWALSLAAMVALAAYLVGGHGRLDFQGYALGRDFVNAWTAGHLVREGRTPQIFEPTPFLAAARRLFDPALPFHFWSYPPPTLLMVAPLGWTGYLEGLIGWTLIGLATLAVGLAAFDRRSGGAPLLWFVLLAPATATNIGLGQNGAFSAALLIGGLALLDRRPWLAGVLLGLLIFKPQIAILLPMVALAGRRWRLIGGAAVSVAAVVGVTTLAFGAAVWPAFVAQTLPMQTQMLRFGSGPFQTMMTSAYMSARVLGAPWTWASVAQAPFSVAAGVATWRVWRPEASASFEVRAAVLMAATFVATPQGFNYDLAPVALAAAVLWRSDDAPVAKTLAALAWIAPAVMAASALGPVGIVLRREPVVPLILTAVMLRLWWIGEQTSSVGAAPLTRSAGALPRESRRWR